MYFGFRHSEFVEDISCLTRNVAASTFKGPGPSALCHYTREESAEKIIATRTFWATCLTEQSDETELLHGISLVEDIAATLVGREPDPFVQQVFSDLPDHMRRRRSMLFITCFCGGEMSPFHIERYGNVCFRFTRPNGAPPPLTLNGFSGDRWFSPVVYDENDQRRIIRKFLTTASMMIEKHSRGSVRPDNSEEWIASAVRRDVGQCLLTIVASFKRKNFRRDREWRLIVSPSLSLSNTAPDLIDEGFMSSIESQPRRHVSLQREAVFPPLEGSIWPPPFEYLEPYDEVIRVATPSRWEKMIALMKGQ